MLYFVIYYIFSVLRFRWHLLKKSLMRNFIYFCALHMKETRNCAKKGFRQISSNIWDTYLPYFKFLKTSVPSQHFLTQSQQWEGHNIMWKLFKVTSKDGKTTSMLNIWKATLNMFHTLFWFSSLIPASFFRIFVTSLKNNWSNSCL